MDRVIFICQKCKAQTEVSAGIPTDICCQTCGSKNLFFTSDVQSAPVDYDGRIGERKLRVKEEVYNMVHEYGGPRSSIWLLYRVWPPCSRCGNMCMEQPLGGLCADCVALAQQEVAQMQAGDNEPPAPVVPTVDNQIPPVAAVVQTVASKPSLLRRAAKANG